MDMEERARLCQKCYFCQQGVDKTISIDTKDKPVAIPALPVQKQPNPVPQPQRFVWYVFVTNACNLRCKYCYANNQPGSMDDETIEHTLLWLFKKQPNKLVNVHFFGGEPTTQWDKLVKIVEVGNIMAKENGYTAEWSMTTNGTLLTDARLEWIKEKFKPNAPFLLSCDGRPDTHNKNRVLAGGGPTHHMIPVDKILKMWPNLEVRPTIESDSAKDWFEDFRWLRNKGFRAIAVEPDYECEWTGEQLADYENLLVRLGEYYQLAVKAGHPMQLKFIDSVRSGLQQQQSPGGRMCGVGFNCGGIDHRGYLYACQRYASYSDPERYALGDVVNGWDEYKLIKTQSLFRECVRGSTEAGFICEECNSRQFCFKGCNAANSKLMGVREVALPMYCTITQIETRVALAVLAGLGVLDIKRPRMMQRPVTCGKKV